MPLISPSLSTPGAIFPAGSSGIATAALFPDESFAWVHIDARHDYDSVVADINAWAPKVKPAGWLSGDDYQADWWVGGGVCGP